MEQDFFEITRIPSLKVPEKRLASVADSSHDVGLAGTK